MRCNSLDEQTILLRLFGNRALYLIQRTGLATRTINSVSPILRRFEQTGIQATVVNGRISTSFYALMVLFQRPYSTISLVWLARPSRKRPVGVEGKGRSSGTLD